MGLSEKDLLEIEHRIFSRLYDNWYILLSKNLPDALSEILRDIETEMEE